MGGPLHRIKSLKARAKARSGEFWWYTLLLTVALRFGDVINLYVGAILVPKYISIENLGAVLPLANLGLFISIPLGIIAGTYAKFLNTSITNNELGKVRSMLTHLFMMAGGFSIVAGATLFASRHLIEERMKISDPYVIGIIILIGVANCWAPIIMTAATSMKLYRPIIIGLFLAPFTRLAIVAALIASFQVSGYLAGSFFLRFFPAMICAYALIHFFKASPTSKTYREDIPKILRYIGPIAVLSLLGSLQALVEPWVIRQRMSPADSSGYYMVFLLGNIPVFLFSPLIAFMFPTIAQKKEQGGSTVIELSRVLVFLVIAGICACICLYVLGPWLMGLRSDWQKYVDYSPYIWRIAAIGLTNLMLAAFVTHERACIRFRFLWFYIPIIALEVGLLYGLNALPSFKSVLPETVFDYLILLKSSLPHTIWVMMATRVLMVVAFVTLFSYHFIKDKKHAVAGPNESNLHET